LFCPTVFMRTFRLFFLASACTHAQAGHSLRGYSRTQPFYSPFLRPSSIHPTNAHPSPHVQPTTFYSYSPVSRGGNNHWVLSLPICPQDPKDRKVQCRVVPTKTLRPTPPPVPVSVSTPNDHGDGFVIQIQVACVHFPISAKTTGKMTCEIVPQALCLPPAPPTNAEAGSSKLRKAGGMTAYPGMECEDAMQAHSSKHDDNPYPSTPPAMNDVACISFGYGINKIPTVGTCNMVSEDACGSHLQTGVHLQETAPLDAITAIDDVSADDDDRRLTSIGSFFGSIFGRRRLGKMEYLSMMAVDMATAFPDITCAAAMKEHMKMIAGLLQNKNNGINGAAPYTDPIAPGVEDPSTRPEAPTSRPVIPVTRAVCPADCAEYFDGCNTCQCSGDGTKAPVCTEMACFTTTEPKCLKEFMTTQPTTAPTQEPTAAPTQTPTNIPTNKPTATSTIQPSNAPTSSPTKAPTTLAPTTTPTAPPTMEPTAAPTKAPTTLAPTAAPTAPPTMEPTAAPTKAPTTLAPTAAPTAPPTSPCEDQDAAVQAIASAFGVSSCKQVLAFCANPMPVPAALIPKTTEPRFTDLSPGLQADLRPLLEDKNPLPLSSILGVTCPVTCKAGCAA